MLIILEGCDGVGKSTVANKLAKILNAEIIHCNRYTPNDVSFFTNIIYASETRNIIADRFCYGQFAYQEEKDRPLGKTCEGVHELSNRISALENLHRLETLMLGYNCKVIHVTAPLDEIKDRLQLRREKIIDKLSVEEVVNRFKGIFENSLLEIIEWNTGRDINE